MKFTINYILKVTTTMKFSFVDLAGSTKLRFDFINVRFSQPHRTYVAAEAGIVVRQSLYIPISLRGLQYNAQYPLNIKPLETESTG